MKEQFSLLFKPLYRSLLLFVLLVVSVGCTRQTAVPPPDANLPIYPNAQNLSVSSTPTTMKSEFISSTTFLTPDSAQAVLEFYTEELPKQGWKLNQQNSTASKYDFDWQEGCPHWGLCVVTQDKVAQTGVELIFSRFQCE